MTSNAFPLFNIISFVVGSIVTFIYLNVVSSGQALQILTILTICTLGVGLALVSAIAWLVGMLIVGSIWGLYILINRVNGSSVFRLFNQNQSVLINYIKQAKAYGLSDTQIFNRLRSEGWNNDEIEEAQRLVMNE